MGDVNPEGILSSIGEANLIVMADNVGIKVPELKRGKGVDKDKLVELLVENVTKEGTNRVLSVLKGPRLKKLISQPDVELDKKWTAPDRPYKTKPPTAKKVEKGKEKGEKGKGKRGKKKKTEEDSLEDRPYPTKATMVSILSEYLGVKQWKDILEGLKEKTLLGLCGDIDDLSNYDDDEKAAFTKEEMINAVLTNVNTFGLNHLLSTLNVEDLQKVCKDMKLKVDSSSQEVIIDSIIEKKNFKKAKKKTEKPSRKAPSIKKGISKVDLNHWYTRTEIEKWLKDKKEEDPEIFKDLKLTGKKTILIERLLKILEGDIEGATKKKQKRGRSSSRSREKSKEEKSKEEKGKEEKGKEDKSKEEKSEDTTKKRKKNTESKETK